MSDASGFSSTSFGLPSTPILPATGSLFAPNIGTPNVLCRVIGIYSVGFGVPFCPTAASGFVSTNIGSAVAKYNQTVVQAPQERTVSKEVFDAYLPVLVPPATSITSTFTDTGDYGPLEMYYRAIYTGAVLSSEFNTVDVIEQPGYAYLLYADVLTSAGTGVAGNTELNLSFEWTNPLDATDFDQYFVFMSRANGASDVSVEISFYREVNGIETVYDVDTFTDSTIPQWNNGSAPISTRTVVSADTISFYISWLDTGVQIEQLVGTLTHVGFSGHPINAFYLRSEGSSIRHANLYNTDDVAILDVRTIYLNYGWPLGSNYSRARYVQPLIKFGTWTGYTPVNQSDAVTGLSVQKFGTPILLRGLPPSAFICTATGVGATQFGSPATPTSGAFAARSITPTLGIGAPSVAPFAQTGTASGIALGRIGSPESGIIEVSTGLNASLLVGEPTVVSRKTVSGSKFPIFPTPVSTEQHNVTGGVRKLPRFGAPSSSLGNIHSAYGINLPPRFGRGVAYQRFNYPTTSTKILNVGFPDSFMSHKILHIPPNTNFGTPLLRRNQLC